MSFDLQKEVSAVVALIDDKDPRFYPGPRPEIGLVLVASLWQRAMRREIHGKIEAPYQAWSEMPREITIEQVVEAWCVAWGYAFNRPSGQRFLAFVRTMIEAEKLYYSEPCLCGCNLEKASMFHPQDLSRYHAAAKLIEEEGDEGYHTCVARYGVEMANILLIAHLRRAYGAMESYPARESIPSEVNEHLKKKHLLREQ